MKNLDDETVLDDVETDPTSGARRAVQIRYRQFSRESYNSQSSRAAALTTVCDWRAAKTAR